MADKTEEHKRLEEDKSQQAYWRRWGSYISERQWGTVREDYSASGEAWQYLPHDHARSQAYRWGEDGIAGLCDNHQRLCFALALWNGKDHILKERLFGLDNHEGNHGEDVKEYYYYLDNTPTHSYMKFLYKYPQAAFPYDQLIHENRNRNRLVPEFELADTQLFDDNHYFDVFVEYAKKTPEDIFIKITIHNRGHEDNLIHVIPTLWFRNTWSWTKEKTEKPKITFQSASNAILESSHPSLGKRWLIGEDRPTPLFTENETNLERLYKVKNKTPYVKDAFHRYIVNREEGAVNPNLTGTKAGLFYTFHIDAGEKATLHLRLTDNPDVFKSPFNEVDKIFPLRKTEADQFYKTIIKENLDEEHQNIARQALAGMLWSKQFYYYVIEEWLNGDSALPPPPPSHKNIRNQDWIHVYADNVLSMPDKWEYPWFASWDMAFHCIPLSMVDPEFAKKQLILLTREWFMHPNGQIPAYEWNFSDVNPPVQAWAAWRVYKIVQKQTGKRDLLFLERVFQKLLLNFTWWVNRKDANGRNIFQGGFLGLDNISVFDRSKVLPRGGILNQSDATSWMGMFCLNMLTIALELAQHNASYEDIASKFFEHFLYIADAMTRIGKSDISLWDNEDGFFYDVVSFPNGPHFSLKVHSMVGLIPLYAVMTIEPEILQKLSGFKQRFNWFIKNRKDLCSKVAEMQALGEKDRRILSIVDQEKLKRILARLLDEKEFFSDYGIRAISAYHRDNPYVLNANHTQYRVDYEPAESTTWLFGGNSNWRGPIWFPVNYLIIESLQKFHYYYGDDFKVECPTGSGNMLNLWEVAGEIAKRLIKIFLVNKKGKRPSLKRLPENLQQDSFWKDHHFFNEYFHGDNGAGLGASHQTGWTGVIAKMVQQYGEYSMGEASYYKDTFSIDED